MGMPVNTVAAGGLAVVESTSGFGTPVSEAAPGRGVAVTKVISPAPGLPVIFETIGHCAAAYVATFDGTPSRCAVMSNGNLTVTTRHYVVQWRGVASTMTKTSGKYYFEITYRQCRQLAILDWDWNQPPALLSIWAAAVNCTETFHAARSALHQIKRCCTAKNLGITCG